MGRYSAPTSSPLFASRYAETPSAETDGPHPKIVARMVLSITEVMVDRLRPTRRGFGGREEEEEGDFLGRVPTPFVASCTLAACPSAYRRRIHRSWCR